MLSRPVAGTETPERYQDAATPAWAAALIHDQELHDIVHGFLRLRDPKLKRIAIRMVRSLGAEG